MKRIGVLTSGGDAPGMNTAIWATTRAACKHDMEVVGIKHGYQGLMTKETVMLNTETADRMLGSGGTVLGTARCLAMLTEEGRDYAVKTIRELGIEGLIVCGGDGSFKGANVISDRGIPTIGLPGTIDNDLAYTDYTIGFDTVCNTVVDSIMKIRDTMKAHNRIGIVQVMGRDCGDIALYAGLAAGADYVLVPEMRDEYKDKYDMTNLMTHLNSIWKAGKKHGIIVMAEGLYKEEKYQAEALRNLIEAQSDYTVRETVLGYMQRGGSPTAFDRRLAIESSFRAVELLRNGEKDRVVGIKRNEIFDMDIDDALAMKSPFKKEMCELVNSLHTSR